MRVQFRTNLGSRDAAALQIDYVPCVKYAIVDLPEAAAESLCKRGLADLFETTAPKRLVAQEPVRVEYVAEIAESVEAEEPAEKSTRKRKNSRAAELECIPEPQSE